MQKLIADCTYVYYSIACQAKNKRKTCSEIIFIVIIIHGFYVSDYGTNEKNFAFPLVDLKWIVPIRDTTFTKRIIAVLLLLSLVLCIKEQK